MITTEQIRKLIEEKKVTIGTQATTSAIQEGGLKTVVIASNAAVQTRATIERIAAMANVAIDDVRVTNDVLGTMCKKPFAISVLGIRK
jgi:ribosomal protein L30E